MSCACGSDSTRLKRGMCPTCYQRWLRAQPASLKDTRTRLERFLERVTKTGTCWLWTGAGTPKGYGQFSIGRSHVYAHRWAYEEFVGTIPEGLTIDHLCEIKRCVNPAHMEPVTRGENTRRALLKRIACEHCGRLINRQNMSRHVTSRHEVGGQP